MRFVEDGREKSPSGSSLLLFIEITSWRTTSDWTICDEGVIIACGDKEVNI